MGVLYLVSLLLGITCMLLLDHRFRLFFWRDAKAAAIVTAVGLLFLLAWDLAGIGLGGFSCAGGKAPSPRGGCCSRRSCPLKNPCS